MSADKSQAAQPEGGVDLATQSLPFETEAMRQALFAFLETQVDPEGDGRLCKLGSYQCGVYAFYDYATMASPSTWARPTRCCAPASAAT